MSCKKMVAGLTLKERVIEKTLVILYAGGSNEA